MTNWKAVFRKPMRSGGRAIRMRAIRTASGGPRRLPNLRSARSMRSCRIAEMNRGKRIVIVSHGGVLDAVYRAAHGMDITAPRDFDVLNASINRVHGMARR